MDEKHDTIPCPPPPGEELTEEEKAKIEAFWVDPYHWGLPQEAEEPDGFGDFAADFSQPDVKKYFQDLSMGDSEEGGL